MDKILAVIGPAVLGFLAWRAGRIWLDARRRGLDSAHCVGWALLGIGRPARYWWGMRIKAMSPGEQAGLLARETAALGLNRVDSILCPLCGAEIEHVWTLDPDRQPAIAPGPIQCPRCDFRLDACRHCAHFLPGSPLEQGQFRFGSDDMSFGRCGFYKESQPVEQVSPPEMARRLKERGWESIRAPRPITDSFVPPDFCTAFALHRKRLQAGGVPWPDARRAALLRLLAPHPAPRPSLTENTSQDDAQWLL